MVDDSINQVVSILVSIAALNWALEAFFDYNVLTKLLELTEGTTNYEIAVALIGVAAILKLYWTIEWASDME